MDHLSATRAVDRQKSRRCCLARWVALAAVLAVVCSSLMVVPITGANAATFRQTKVTAPDRSGTAELGSAVALSADGTRMAVGSPRAGGGEVRVFEPDGDEWAQIAVLSPSDGGPTDRFGASIALSRDGRRLVVGSPGDGSAEVDAGKVYVFEDDGDAWAEIAAVVAPDATRSDGLGSSVAISASGDRIVAGAPFQSVNGPAAGAVYVIDEGEDGWSTTGVTPADAGPRRTFGFAVDISDDGGRFVATAEGALAGASAAAYVFDEFPIGSWVETAVLGDPEPAEKTEFGHAVGMASDGQRIAVGDPADRSVLVFDEATGWSPERVAPTDADPADRFGHAIAIAGDRLLVGADRTDDGAGGAYMFHQGDEGWIQIAEEAARDATRGALFGSAVALGGDVAAIGSRWADQRAGAVYVTRVMSDAIAPALVTSPGLYPAFDPAIRDYVVRCEPGQSVRVSGFAPADQTIGIDDLPAVSGAIDEEVELSAGQSFRVAVHDENGSNQYTVRCLPQSFPEWSTQIDGEPSVEYLLVTPNDAAGYEGYVSMFDANGVPLWWWEIDALAGKQASNPALLEGLTVAWTERDESMVDPEGVHEVRALDGALVRNVQGAECASTGSGQMVTTADGTTLVLCQVERPETVDLSAWGGPDAAVVLDTAIQELDAEGGVVWSWNSADAIALDEADPKSLEASIAEPSLLPDGRTAVDMVGIDAIDVDEGGILLSASVPNAVYRIEKATGEIDWKLGGTPTAASLELVGGDLVADPTPSKPMDVAVLEDGTVTVFSGPLADDDVPDDRSAPMVAEWAHVTVDEPVEIPPTGLRYAIDTEAQSATLVEYLPALGHDYEADDGRARRGPDGAWVVSSTGHDGATVSEHTPDGDVTLALDIASTSTVHGVPIEHGVLDLTALRDGMDRMYPRAPLGGAPPAEGVSPVADAPVVSDGELVWPLGGAVVSAYGNRVHPILGTERPHAGIDVDGQMGEPIVAAGAGTVSAAEEMGGYGNAVVIDHGEGNTTLYAHMSSMAVAPGQPVAAGEVIGYVGSTGLSTGPHLHFETRIDDVAVDPLTYLL